MEKKPYHHGNLEESLIEAGIILLDKVGLEQFSLRKVAIACGVSHAAPYKHFNSKQDLLDAMKKYVEKQFSAALKESLEYYKNDPDRIIYFGQAYLKFFIKNPHYFRFFITHTGLEIDLSDLQQNSNYEPFELFKKTAIEEFTFRKIPVALYKQLMIAMWAMVHGVTSLATMEGVIYDNNWVDLLGKILKENQTLEG
ncbi:MAG: TetR/AcrR family transcriptional regulator [Oscillospiraceae bacterium]|nr:TetR/AcrR family transcriptional regulator [Oscillospiraceae bacterium]